MLALLFFALALPLALFAFVVGAAAATRHHRSRLPQLLAAQRDRTFAEIIALAEEAKEARLAERADLPEGGR